MNLFSNIWEHPKTSAAGLLIAVVTIAGVLSQQGITFGMAGKGTVVSLVGALAAALLGLLAKDPGTGTEGTREQCQTWCVDADCIADSAAVDERVLGDYGGAGCRELDSGAAERGSDC